MADRKRAPIDRKEARRHNLKALNPTVKRPALAPSLTAAEREHGLRFILQTAGGASPERLAAAIQDRHDLVVVVEPLFSRVDPTADANGMDRYFLATLPGLARRDIGDNVFDIGYALADTPGCDFLSVEPDIPHAVFHGTPEVAVAENLRPCNVEGFTPADRAWHLRSLRVPQAWAVPPPAGGEPFGRGSVVAHIDTGWAQHDDFEPARVDFSRGWDFIDDDADPSDPLERGSLLGGPASPGHGTATGSVIAGRGDGGTVLPDPAELQMWGVAPGSTLVPIRAIRFVFFVFDGDVVKAIEFAAKQGAHVISMSLGGIPTEALEVALNYAVARDVIVCAAAGNCLPSVVVGPAIYPNCIAVAGSNVDDLPWQFSSRGPQVAITAPAENVWASRRGPGDSTTSTRAASQGTSFSTAAVAGLAALWLAFHGRDRLLAKYKGRTVLHHVFRHLLQQTARQAALLPAGQFGSGIADAHALLSATLPDPEDVAGAATLAELAVLTPAEVIAAMYGNVDANVVDARMTSLLGGAESQTATLAERRSTQATAWGPEVIHILAQDQAAYRQFAANLAGAAAAETALPAAASGATGDGMATELERVSSAKLRGALSLAHTSQTQ